MPDPPHRRKSNPQADGPLSTERLIAQLAWRAGLGKPLEERVGMLRYRPEGFAVLAIVAELLEEKRGNVAPAPAYRKVILARQQRCSLDRVLQMVRFAVLAKTVDHS